ncbi:hypothetical protein NM208_g4948 [Fusarium decemcellulare]|uniref:Uncharacterized protein n=1 Tax=Fusarium decemcellulare TaxID=57161 RepID=A0ACC1SIZ5_9HYPO|nr:hypothetical protein NM208_g4948 [Fusarium decemcellulare]
MVPRGLDHFASVPWCSPLLQHPRLTLLHDEEPIDGDDRNLFFNRLLQSKDAINAFLMFYYKPAENSILQDLTPVPELFMLVDAKMNVSGWPGVSHGGYISTLFDVVGGWHAQCNINRSIEQGHLPKGNKMMTFSLQVTYLKPVLVDRVILLKSYVEKVDGKKMYIKMTLEDESRAILCRGELVAHITSRQARI